MKTSHQATRGVSHPKEARMARTLVRRGSPTMSRTRAWPPFAGRTVASAIAATASVMDIASAAATCHHPRGTPPPATGHHLIPAGAASSIFTDALVPDPPLPPPPIVQLHLYKVGDVGQPDPFERPTCPRSHTMARSAVVCAESTFAMWIVQNTISCSRWHDCSHPQNAGNAVR